MMKTPRNQALWNNRSLFSAVKVSFGFGRDYTYLCHAQICLPKSGDVVVLHKNKEGFSRGDVVAVIDITEDLFDPPWDLSIVVAIDRGQPLDTTLWQNLEDKLSGVTDK